MANLFVAYDRWVAGEYLEKSELFVISGVSCLYILKNKLNIVLFSYEFLQLRNVGKSARSLIR